jgi:peptidoglycan-N-acetylglucosamine deacetylase
MDATTGGHEPGTLSRRVLLTGMVAAAAGTLAACASPSGAQPPATPSGANDAAAGRPQPTQAPDAIQVETPQDAPDVERVPAPHEPLSGLPGDANLLAWTVDDGTSAAVVGAYAAFAAETGTRLTLFVTGSYSSWDENAEALRPLVDSGQVQLANHTWSHPDLTELPDQGIIDELQRTHDFIGERFDVDARPFFRPPFGYYDDRVLAVAAGMGYTTPTLWYGSLADSGLISEQQIVELATEWFLPGHIVIGHLNFEPVTHVFPELHAIIRERDLTTVTLNDVFSSESHP